MRKYISKLILLKPMLASILLATLMVPAAQAQTPEQWTEWGDRVHGGFGSLIALGILIGNDAMEQLHVDRRQLKVDYTDGPATPCPCVIDGVALAVSASVGQKTLTLEPGQTPANLMAKIVFTDKGSGRQLVYEVPQSVLPIMQKINQDAKGVERYNAVVALDPATLFQVSSPKN